MLSAHDASSANMADTAGIDVILIGDNVGMVAMGLDNTMQVTMDDMLPHCRSVSRTTKRAFIISSCGSSFGTNVDSVQVGDLPMGTYEVRPEQAVESAIRPVKSGQVHGTQVEGGDKLCPAIKQVTQA